MIYGCVFVTVAPGGRAGPVRCLLSFAHCCAVTLSSPHPGFMATLLTQWVGLIALIDKSCIVIWEYQLSHVAQKSQRQVQNSLRASTPALKGMWTGWMITLLSNQYGLLLVLSILPGISLLTTCLYCHLCPDCLRTDEGQLMEAMPIHSWILNHQHFFMTDNHQSASKCLGARMALQPS